MRSNKWWFIIGGIVFIAIICTILILNVNKTNEIICNQPYIRFSSSCCLDQNNNGICDNDEIPPQKNLTNCDKINKPTLSLTCQNRTDNTYNYCSLKIGEDVNDDEFINYFAYYTSTYDATVKEQVARNQQLPFSYWNGPAGTIIPTSAFDKYGYYFGGLIPDSQSDGFIVIPYDFENEVSCTNLEVRIQFNDAKLLS